ncbi:MAG: ArnT family glycosyltransferase, partial [Anaerolineae bacterium]
MLDSIEKQPTKTFWLIATAFVLLGLIYSWATPPFESSDEYKHFPVIQHIQQTGELVVLDPENEGKWKQEGAQPPLYYWLMAAATSWVDTGDLDQVHIENRHAFIGNAAQIKNKNLLFHDPEAERFPWSGSILAVYVIRVLSIGLGVGTLWFGWLTGRLLLDEKGALLVVALTAFNPMFLFVSAAVNNDSLSIMLGSAGLYLLIKIWQRQSAGNRPWWVDYTVLGIICGLAMLTKLSLATVLLLAGFVTARGMLLAWRKNNQLKELLQPAAQGLLTLAITLAFVGPWLLRNLRLYGDLTGLSAFIEVQGTRDNPTIWGVDWIAEFGTFFRSFWGLFGGVNVFAPQWFYTVCNLLVVIGVIGLLLKLTKGKRDAKSGIILPVLMVFVTM